MGLMVHGPFGGRAMNRFFISLRIVLVHYTITKKNSLWSLKQIHLGHRPLNRFNTRFSGVSQAQTLVQRNGYTQEL